MSTDTLNRFWLLVTFLLIILIVVSSIIIWNHRNNGEQILISDSRSSNHYGQISINGAVVNPGTYPLKSGDTINDILQSAGGTTSKADSSNIQLIIPDNDVNLQPQKIDINRADVWLLQALPDIGKVRAESIVEYRKNNGLFKTPSDIRNVPGIGESTYSKIEPYITIRSD